jgi:undecaprenyl-diphosphatase
LGLLFDDILEEYLHTPLIIALMLILYGVAFILIEKRNATRVFPTQSLEEISYTQALLIGAFQVLSLIPGTSRSGATILGALLLGITRPVGAKFSFFLAIPVMFGASGLKLLKFLLDGGGFIGWEFFYLLFGAVVAFVISMLTIKLLMRFVEKHDFKVFGWYRIVLGAIVICALVIPTLLG